MVIGTIRDVVARCGPASTPIGELWVAATPAGVVAIGREPPAGAVLDPDAVRPFVEALSAYLVGKRREIDVPLDLRGASAFDVEVWRAARGIPYGATATYGELAALSGHPGAARAVGGSMARCPLSPVVPCHRVVHADGSLRGWGPEAWVKRWLLELEAGAAATSSPSPAPAAATRRPRSRSAPSRRPRGPG